MTTANLLTTSSLVESPFVIVDIGGITFGDCSKSGNADIKFPNFIQGMTAVKINGAVNTYSITLQYQIAAGDDPNLIDEALSSIAENRRIIISYGDWSYPNSIFKEEKAIISTVKSSFDFGASRITYVINAISEAQDLNSTCYNFPGTTSKPSDVIKSMIQNNSYGIKDTFSGMSNINTAMSRIAGDDKPVEIEAKQNITPLNYINYLTSCMTPVDGSGVYKLSYIDETTTANEGSYFKVTKLSANAVNFTSDTAEINVGFPDDKFVEAFNITTDDQWSILYKSNQITNQVNYSYRINDDGKLIVTNAPSISKSSSEMKVTTSGSNWWKEVTTFPITATVTMRGLTRSTLLMSYVKLNVVFYGQKHITSGMYAIQKEEMRIDSKGFRTTLTLVRVGED